jgi:hypothetical protein
LNAGNNIVYPNSGKRIDNNQKWSNETVGYHYLNGEYGIHRFSTSALSLSQNGRFGWYGWTYRKCAERGRSWQSVSNPYLATSCVGSGELKKTLWN